MRKSQRQPWSLISVNKAVDEILNKPDIFFIQINICFIFIVTFYKIRNKGFHEIPHDFKRGRIENVIKGVMMKGMESSLMSSHH